MRQFFKNNFAAIVILVFFILFGLKSLISSPFYTSHDGFTHTARIAAYFQALKEGQFPPRWAGNFNATFGSPIFVYSYPLPYFLGSVFHLVSFDYQSAFRLVMGLSFGLAGLGTYLWLRNRFGQLAGVVGAVYYLWVPYRFLNLYVRGALAESLAYGLLPFVFFFLDKKSWKATVLALTAVFLSHNEVTALVLPVILGWSLINKRLTFGLSAVMAAFGISSFIYMPDFLERNYIRFDQNMNYYLDHFVGWWQLLRSPWGFGFDFPDTVRDGMSFQLGLAQVAVTGVLLLLIFFKKIRDLRVLFFLGLLAVSIFLMIDEPYIREVWKIIPVMRQIVDFPWRFLGLTTLAFSFLAAFFISKVRYSKIWFASLLLIVVLANRNHLSINLPQDFKDGSFDNYTGSSTASSNEYIPVWRTDDQIFPRPQVLEVATGAAQLALQTVHGQEMTWTVQASLPSVIRINRFYFPQTTIERNGQLTVQDIDWEIIRKPQDGRLPYYDDTGLISLKVPPGFSSYHLKFSETPIRQAANLLSLVTFFVIIFV